MELNYNVTEEAYIDFSLFHAKNSKAIRKSMTIQRYIVPIIYFLVAFFLSFVLDWSVLTLVIPLAVLGVLWFVFYPAYFNHLIKRNARKMIREGKNDGVLGKHTMIFTEEGLREISQKGETTLSWSGIENFREDESNFYLYNSGVSAFIIPKDTLDNNSEAFRSYLLDKVSK